MVVFCFILCRSLATPLSYPADFLISQQVRYSTAVKNRSFSGLMTLSSAALVGDLVVFRNIFGFSFSFGLLRYQLLPAVTLFHHIRPAYIVRPAVCATTIIRNVRAWTLAWRYCCWFEYVSCFQISFTALLPFGLNLGALAKFRLDNLHYRAYKLLKTDYRPGYLRHVCPVLNHMLNSFTEKLLILRKTMSVFTDLSTNSFNNIDDLLLDWGPLLDRSWDNLDARASSIKMLCRI